MNFDLIQIKRAHYDVNSVEYTFLDVNTDNTEIPSTTAANQKK